MQKYLDEISRAETYMLYDPSVISEDQLASKNRDETILNMTHGHALAYADPSGPLNVLLLIDEEINEILKSENSSSIHNACLKSPSGHLVVSSIDEMRQLNKSDSKQCDTVECDIPAGNYRLDAYEFERLTETATQESESLLEKILSTAISTVLFITCFILPVAFLAIWMEESLSSAVDMLYLAIIFEVVFWLSVFILSSVQKTYNSVKRDCYPRLVIQLTTLQNMPQEFNAAIMGSGLDHLKNSKTGSY